MDQFTAVLARDKRRGKFLIVSIYVCIIIIPFCFIYIIIFIYSRQFRVADRPDIVPFLIIWIPITGLYGRTIIVCYYTVASVIIFYSYLTKTE